MDVKKLIEKKHSFIILKKILEEEYKLKINLDKNNKYYMITGTNESDNENSVTRQCTGIIINKQGNKILHYFGEKASDLPTEKIKNGLIKMENLYISPYEDGYLIKVFYNENKWNFSTSKHTNIKFFNINEENITNLFELFEISILNTFSNFDDFLNMLENDYCYSFILEKKCKKIQFINKVNLKTLIIENNMNKYRRLKDYNTSKKTEKYILIEKDKIGKTINRFHSSLETLKELLQDFDTKQK